MKADWPLSNRFRRPLAGLEGTTLAGLPPTAAALPRPLRPHLRPQTTAALSLGSDCLTFGNDSLSLVSHCLSLVSHCRSLGNDSRRLVSRSRRLGNGSRSFGNRSRRLAHRCQSLGIDSRSLVSECRSLGKRRPNLFFAEITNKNQFNHINTNSTTNH